VPLDIEEETFSISIESVVVSQLIDQEVLNFSLGETSFSITTTEDVFGIVIVEETLNFHYESIQMIVGEEDMQYASRVDFVSDLLIYRGEALPGTLDGASTWRIRRLVIGLDDDVTTEYADGNSNFDNVWADRALPGAMYS
jgi:hypothetical protein